MKLPTTLLAHSSIGALVLSAASWSLRGCAEPSHARELAAGVLAKPPEVLLVGNSLVRAGLDPDRLEAQLHRSVFRFTSDGSGSALWYLVAKNVACAAEPRPRAMLMLFVGTELTDPTLDFESGLPADLRELSSPEEPLLWERGYVPALGWLHAEAYRQFEWIRERGPAQDLLERKFRNLVVAPLLGVGARDVQLAFVDVLADRRMRRDLLDAYQGSTRTVVELPDFEKSLARSFLPATVDELRRHSVRPVFVRARSLSRARGNPLSPAMARYQEDLARWLADHEALLIDLSEDPEIRPEHFSAGDHLKPAGAEILTRLVGERLAGPLAEAVPPASEREP